MSAKQQDKFTLPNLLIIIEIVWFNIINKYLRHQVNILRLVFLYEIKCIVDIDMDK